MNTKKYNRFERSVNNPEIRDAIFNNRVILYRELTRLWVCLILVVLGVSLILLGISKQVSSQVSLLENEVAVLKSQVSTPLELTLVEESNREWNGKINLPVPSQGTLSHKELSHELVSNYSGNFEFDFIQIEHEGRPGLISGSTSCGESGTLYSIESPNATMKGFGRGVWITVKGCGGGKLLNPDYQDIAFIYLPYESMERVLTFRDFMGVIESHGVVYQINQDILSELLGLDAEKLPLNPNLPKHPYMD